MVGQNIKIMRDQNGMTQQDVADKLGISKSAVNAWEMGTNVPNLQNIVELAKLFSVSTDYLLDMAEDRYVDVMGLNGRQLSVVRKLVDCFKTDNGQKENHRPTRPVARDSLNKRVKEPKKDSSFNKSKENNEVDSL